MLLKDTIFLGFEKGVNDLQLQKCSDNSIKYDDFILNTLTSLNSDEASLNHEVNQSMGPGNYAVDNTFSCDCGSEEAKENYSYSNLMLILMVVLDGWVKMVV